MVVRSGWVGSPLTRSTCPNKPGRAWQGAAWQGKARPVLVRHGKARTPVYRVPARKGNMGLGRAGRGVVRPGQAGSGQAGSGGARTGSAGRGKDDCVSITTTRPGEAWLGEAWYSRARPGMARQGIVPKTRQPKEVWSLTRARIWARDSGLCRHCAVSVALDVCHIDHIRSGKLASNKDTNLRVLCRRCHVLRADMRHRGMIASAIRDGIIPPDWRPLVWED